MKYIKNKTKIHIKIVIDKYKIAKMFYLAVAKSDNSIFSFLLYILLL